jgi:hypothetical protein
MMGEFDGLSMKDVSMPVEAGGVLRWTVGRGEGNVSSGSRKLSCRVFLNRSSNRKVLETARE